MSALPAGWAEVELGEVIEPKQTRNPRTDGSKSFRYIDVQAVDNLHNRVSTARELASERAPSRARRLVRKDDVLFCLVRPYLRNIARVPPELDGQVASTAFCVLRPSAAMASRFLFHQVLRGSFISEVPTYGTSPPSAREDEFLRQPITLAPLPEQHRIVAKIESLFASLDEGVAALKRAEANLERYRASVLKSAVEGRLTVQWRWENPPEETGEELLRRIMAERRKRWEAEQLAKFAAKGRKPPRNWKAKYKEPVAPDTGTLPELPEGWCWATVDQIVWAMMNGYGKRSNTPGGTPRMVLRLADIRHDQISYQSPRYLDCTSQQIAKYRLAERDVLIVRVNGSPDLVGRMVDCRNTNGDILFCDHFIRAKCTTLIAAAWLRLCSNTERFRSHVERTRVSTAGQHTVSQGVILPFALPLPPEKEVLAILALADLLVSQSKPVEAALVDGRVNASALRQSILKRAFEGGLVPQDAADEPASVLLERIRAEREEKRKRDTRRRAKPRRQPKSRVP